MPRSRSCFNPLVSLTAACCLLVGAAGGCQKSPSSSAPAEPEPLAKRGQRAYQTYCIACHNSDPKRDGVVGPAIQGSSRELVEARVLRNEYPPGYKPKRTSKAMVAIPQAKDEIDALTAYLNAE
jgi:mono/diheme cytochrome c family protein